MSSAPASEPRLNPRRLRAQALALGICLWGVYAWVLATPGLRDRNHLIKGTDFQHFYTLGSIALARRGDLLYDMTAQSALLAQRVPEAADTQYLPLYGPQVSLLFAPFAMLPYGTALASWWLLTTATYVFCVFAIWRSCAHLQSFGGTVFLVALAYPAFFHLIAWGQTSAVALACFTMGYLLLRDNRPLAAGLALGCLAFKPQLAIAAGFVFLFTQAGRVLVGATLAAAAQLAVGWFYYGAGAMRDYLRHFANIPQVTSLLEPRLYQTHCLRTFWQMLVPWPTLAFALYAVSALLVLAFAARVWQSRRPLGVRYSALLLATVLVSPHLTVYDLVVLAPALLLVANGLASDFARATNRTVAALCYLIYLLPLVGFTARWTHIQLSVLAMVSLFWILGRLNKQEMREGIAS